MRKLLQRGRAAAPRTGTRRGQDGYLLAAAMFLVALSSILAAKAAQDLSAVHQREMEEELKFRGQRIVRAILDWKRDHPGNQFPKLEDLTKPPKRYLHALPPDPLTARYDEDGKLVEKTGRWQPILQGISAPMLGGRGRQGEAGRASETETAGTMGRTPGGPVSAVRSYTPLPCDQSVPGWEKNRPVVGVYSCAEGTSLTMYKGEAGLAYQEWHFVAVPTGTETPAMLLRDLVDCPGQECVVAPR